MTLSETSTKKLWYLLCSKPNKEQYAKENLVRQGYEVYLPMFRHKKRFRGRYQSVVEPMFPRYLFILLSMNSDNWSPIRSTYGVSNIVYFGDQAASLNNDVIKSLKKHEDESEIIQLPERSMGKGDNVRIVDGAMAGLEGVILAKNAKARVCILLNCIGKALEVSVPINDLVRV